MTLRLHWSSPRPGFASSLEILSLASWLDTWQACVRSFEGSGLPPSCWSQRLRLHNVFRHHDPDRCPQFQFASHDALANSILKFAVLSRTSLQVDVTLATRTADADVKLRSESSPSIGSTRQTLGGRSLVGSRGLPEKAEVESCASFSRCSAPVLAGRAPHSSALRVGPSRWAAAVHR